MKKRINLLKIMILVFGMIILWNGEIKEIYADDVTLTPSETSISLDMTGTKTQTVTITAASESGSLPAYSRFEYSSSNDNIICSNGVTSALAPSESAEYLGIKVTGQYGGSSKVTVNYYNDSTNTLLATTSFTVTIGPNFNVYYRKDSTTIALSSQTKYYNKPLTLRIDEPTMSGYGFAGWATTLNADQPEYQPGDVYNKNESVYMYAVWKDYEWVTYNVNGGYSGPSSGKKLQGIPYTITSEVPKRSGYDCIGWATNKNATTVEYKAGDTYTEDSAITLYAVWKAQEYTYTFDDNGGSNGPGNLTKTYNVKFTFPDTIPVREGYDFLGWDSNSTSTTAYYEPGDTCYIESDKTFYAIWKTAEYTIIFNANGGSSAPSSKTKTHGQSLTYLGTAYKSGYTFVGWSEDMYATSAQYTSSGPFTENKDVTLYAVWKIKSFTLAYDSNGGEGVPDSVYDEYGTNISISNLKPERVGYTFRGWARNADATSPSYGAGDTITLSDNITLYAVWKAEEYTVTFYANGGYGEPASQKKSYGTDLVLTTQIPTRTGYTFMGWALSNNIEEVVFEPGAVYTANEEISLYAVWKIDIYQITYNANGGTGVPAGQSGEYGITIAIRTSVPTRTGYTFLGWSENQAATYGAYNSGDSIRLEKNMILYAVWEKIITETDNSQDNETSNSQINTGTQTGTNGNTQINSNGTTQGTGTNTGGTTQVTGLQVQIITVSSQNVSYKKNKKFKLGATTNGNGTLTYKSSNKKVATVSKTGKVTIKGYGKATITIKASETSTYQKATKEITIKIVPKKMSLKKVSSPKKKYVSAAWKKDSTVTGYQMYICLRKDFKKGAYERTFKKSMTKMTLKGLKSKKTYYVKIRAYKTVGKTRYYGAWSTVKKIKIK